MTGEQRDRDIAALISSATPRPWHQYGNMIWGGSGDNSANICALSEPRAARYVEFTHLRIDSPDYEEAKANAALIVEAVNAFDPGREEHIRELIAAARSVREVLLVALREACELSDFGAEKHRAIMQLDRALAHFEGSER